MKLLVSKLIVFLSLGLVACQGHTAGKLMIVGGALRSDNEAVYRAYIDAIPSRWPDVAIVPAASGRPAYYAQQFEQDLRKFGFNGEIHVLPVAVKDDSSTDSVDESTWSEGAYDPKVVEKLKTVGGIWFVGGDQTRITDTLVQKDGADSPLLAAIRKQLVKGGIVGGTSAGAAIMSSPMIAAGDSLSALTEPRSEEYAGMQSQESGQLMIKNGLGFLDAGIVDQHFDRKSRLGRLIRALEPPMAAEMRRGYGIDEDTAVLADLNSGEMTVLGRGTLVLVDARHADFAENSPRFAVKNLSLSVLSEGDRYNWRSGKMNLEGAATVGKEAFGYRAEQGAGLTLPNGRLDHLLGFSLLDNSETDELRRYAFAENGPGVLFRFEQAEDSQGFWRYGSGTKDQYSIQGVRLSIEPVTVSIKQ
ncbi:Cyanophycinase precursor [Microbulbifer aggregans]|uniref:Cyanophycinase n=1 Tax=Microbulbifer aggregans TaxID=1769779 RepID=A0A1C9WB53_9GAMM|nr:cyanophycinase [Microbulbifer aggregans]AOS98380.1 Cyanophycinase precursor [Microbulbifer aggregans]